MAELIMTEEGSTPSTPSSTQWKIYPKSTGLFILEDTGTEMGPLIEDAPADGNQYARKDNDWEEVTASSGGDGWTAGTGTWSYSSADDPTFIISINADVTALIGVGDRIKLTQTTAKYFIVTVVGAFSAGATLVTVYGGTDYDLANASITNPFYSHVKVPFGFNPSPAKWSESLSNTSLQTQATPTQNTWYNPGTLSLSMPIGAWRVRWKVFLQAGDASAVNVGCQCTMSTANNSESDADMTTYAILTVPAGSTMGIPVNLTKLVTVASKTTQYLNARTISSGLDNLYFANNAMGLILTFECAYL